MTAILTVSMSEGILFTNAAALVVGALLGIFFGFSWRRIVSAGRGREFFGRVGKVFHSMLLDQDANFIRLYQTLICEAGRYVGGQALGLLVALAPIIALCWLGGPAYHEWRNARADYVSVHPVEDVQFFRGIEGVDGAEKPGLVPISAISAEGKGSIHFPGNSALVQDVRANNAIGPSQGLKSLLLESLGFQVFFVDPSLFGTEPHFIVLRPWCGDFNPLWPYLGDPEFFLFLGMGLVSLGAMFFRGKTKNIQPSKGQDGTPAISFVDYLLIDIATAAPGVFSWLGEKESRIYRKDLEHVAIDRPIFVTGLARAGTTIVLELLSSMPSVATHQYRDFPFVMIPMWWQRFNSIFSAKNSPLERPHKDGIMITRESPEAFEEPIWQYFFPHVHEENSVHTIGEKNGTDEFAKFYLDHIRKILFIRKGTRYLSKGNYNITRIEYIAKLFPDARFVIPVRHPIEHVWSLVRQNELFKNYSEADDRIPNYLRAAGHYEFGPQRVPICLHEETCPRVLEAWRSGREHIGYAIQWAEVYKFARELKNREVVSADRLYFLKYEDLCARPFDVLAGLMKFCGLDCPQGVSAAASRIKPGRLWSLDLDRRVCLEIWEEVAGVAESFGYRLDGISDGG